MIDATRFMFDSDTERILLGTYKRDRTAVEISEVYGIPIATCYRKVHELRKAGLLISVGVHMGNNGKVVKLYRANLQDAYVFYDNGRMKIRMSTILQMSKDFESRFHKISIKADRE